MNKILLYWQPFLEIVILSYVIYRMLVFFEGTRARNVLRGVVILSILYFIFQKLGLHTLNWIMTKIFALSVVAVLILFQPELREGLARLGRGKLFFTPQILKEGELELLIKQVVGAVEIFSQRKTGALIVWERGDSLKSYSDSGIALNANISEELLETIFTYHSPLHDGAVIISGNILTAAGCLLPLTDNTHLSRAYGTRHRAALGLVEDTDALVIIVSEETGNISLAREAHMDTIASKEELYQSLKKFLNPQKGFK